MREINLILGQRKKNAGLYLQKKTVRLVFLGLDLLLAVLMGVIFFMFLQAEKKLKSGSLKINLLTQEIKKQEKKESYLSIISSRSAAVDKIINGQASKDSYLTDLNPLFVPDFVPSLLDMDTNEAFSISGFCLTTQCLSNLYERIEELKEKKLFSGLMLRNVSKRADNFYDLKVELKR